MNRIDRLLTLRHEHLAERRRILSTVQREQRQDLTPDETKRFREAVAALKDIDEQIADLKDEEARSGRNNPDVVAALRASSRDDWAARTHKAIRAMSGEARALVSGSLEVPSIITPAATPKARPARLIDLLINRVALESNSYTYYRQNVRTSNANVVADGATKPTSTFTLTEVEDRARVVATLTESFPVRLFQDAAFAIEFLESEAREAVLDEIEQQIISGAGTGENMTGLTVVAGTTPVAFSTDAVTTLRKGLTALQQAGEVPTAWLLNPVDAEALDLTREATGGIGFLLDGVTEGNDRSANVLGPTSITRVVTNSVPAGTAILGDFTKLRLAVRENMRIDVDTAGDLFATNSAVIRAEARVGVQHLRPSAFAICDLTE